MMTKHKTGFEALFLPNIRMSQVVPSPVDPRDPHGHARVNTIINNLKDKLPLDERPTVSKLLRFTVNIGRINATNVAQPERQSSWKNDLVATVLNYTKMLAPKTIYELVRKGVNVRPAPTGVDYFPYDVHPGEFIVGRKRFGFPHIITFSANGLFVVDLMPDVGMSVTPLLVNSSIDFTEYDYYICCYDVNKLNCLYPTQMFPDIFFATNIFSPGKILSKIFQNSQNNSINNV